MMMMMVSRYYYSMSQYSNGVVYVGPIVFFNDTGNSLYEVPMNMISNETFPVVTSLCYEIHGEAG